MYITAELEIWGHGMDFVNLSTDLVSTDTILGYNSQRNGRIGKIFQKPSEVVLVMLIIWYILYFG